MLPVAINGPVTFRTYKLWFGPGDFVAEIVDKGIAIGPVVTVETMRVDAVLEIDLRVLRQRAVGLFGRRNDLVAFAATVRENGNVVLRFQTWLANWSCIRRRGGDLRLDRDGTSKRKRVGQKQHGKRD